MVRSSRIAFALVQAPQLDGLAAQWGETAARHFHVDDGFMVSATSGARSVGLISARWRQLPPPLAATKELYIDFLEVLQDFRRRGIASQLVGMAVEKARREQAYQVRAWSSTDKLEAIPMWKELGFGLCPATTYPGGKEVKGFFVTLLLN